MTAVLLPNGKVQFIDINGVPLALGTVSFYVPGTFTPKDTWQDRDQEALNTNPVVLDERGQAAIWGTGLYRQIVDDVDGNQIWDVVTEAQQIDDGGGVLTVPNGGTGAATLTGIVIGNGAAAFTTVTAPTGEVVGTTDAQTLTNKTITDMSAASSVGSSGIVAANSVGFRGLPPNAQTGAYVLALADSGKVIPITTGGITIPANGSIAFPIGTAISIYNNSGSSQNIAITTDTLRLAGTATTGTRAVAQYGLATVIKVASTTWVCAGMGVT